MECGKNGKNLNEAISKICQLTKVFLQKPKLVLMDEDALGVPQFDSMFYMEQLFTVLKSSGFFSISKNYRNLYLYSRVYVISNQHIAEMGPPLDLVEDKTSLLYRILSRDDIRTVRTLENKIEKNQKKFLKFLDDNLFNIPDTTHRSQASTKQQTAVKASEDEKDDEHGLMIIDKKEDQIIQKKSNLSEDSSSSLDGNVQVRKKHRNKSPVPIHQAFLKMNSANYSNGGEDLQDMIDARNSEKGEKSQIRRDRKLNTGEPMYKDQLENPYQTRDQQNSANTERSGGTIKQKFFKKNLPLLTVSKANDNQLPSYSGIDSPNQLSSSSNQNNNQNKKRYSKKSADFQRQDSLSLFNKQLSFKDHDGNLSIIDGQSGHNIGSNPKLETLSKMATPTSNRLGRDIIQIIEDNAFDSNDEGSEIGSKEKVKSENLKTEGNEDRKF